APNTPFHAITPIAFSFSDGVQTITNLTPPLVTSFAVATGAAGQITQWVMVAIVSNTGAISTARRPIFSVQDEGSLSVESFGFNLGRPGRWTINGVPQVPDAGSTISLMTLTFMALGVAAGRLKRVAG